jgi:hypothetical protein
VYLRILSASDLNSKKRNLNIVKNTEYEDIAMAAFSFEDMFYITIKEGYQLR